VRPSAHVAISAPLAVVLAWRSGLAAAAWFSCGALLIDVDHFIFYVLRTGRFSPIEMFAWFRETDLRCTAASYYGLHIFHAAEVFVLLALASHFLPYLSWLLLGMGLHLLLDYIWLYKHPVLSVKVRALSWTEHFIRRWRGEREIWREK
jgi:hypothetical protein